MSAIITGVAVKIISIAIFVAVIYYYGEDILKWFVDFILKIIDKVTGGTLSKAGKAAKGAGNLINRFGNKIGIDKKFVDTAGLAFQSNPTIKLW